MLLASTQGTAPSAETMAMGYVAHVFLPTPHKSLLLTCEQAERLAYHEFRTALERCC